VRETLRFFRWSALVTVAALVAAWFYGGLAAVGIVALLIALESSISFDNAVVNARVLRQMGERWQTVFLTIGIVIAVVGMRLVFPIAIVAVTTGLGFVGVVDQALNDQSAYAESVEEAAALIGAFGGMFLLLVSLSFLLDDERELFWLRWLEQPLAKAGRVPGIGVAIAAIVLIAVSQLLSVSERDVLLAGLVGIVVFLVVHGIQDLIEGKIGGGDGKATGAAGFASFLYLEMLDASFSLDGVLGAFAISTDIVIVALGLGVGAIYVRSLTVLLVRRQSLQSYRYLEHGAHWAIGALGIFLLVSIQYHLPEWVTGSIGLGTIAAAFVSSVVANRREDGDATPQPSQDGHKRPCDGR
jgi:uncharacterized protein